MDSVRRSGRRSARFVMIHDNEWEVAPRARVSRAGMSPDRAGELSLSFAVHNIRRMKSKRILGCALVLGVIVPAVAHAQASYLFVWAGGKTGNEMMATIDATPGSRTYGRVVATASTGQVGMPHYTEPELGANGHLLANDSVPGRRGCSIFTSRCIREC